MARVVVGHGSDLVRARAASPAVHARALVDVVAVVAAVAVGVEAPSVVAWVAGARVLRGNRLPGGVGAGAAEAAGVSGALVGVDADARVVRFFVRGDDGTSAEGNARPRPKVLNPKFRKFAKFMLG